MKAARVALAELGDVELVNAGRQCGGSVDLRWLFPAMLEVAVVLCLLVAACGVHAQTIAQSTPPTVTQRFDAALLEYERNHWPEAYAAFTVLADGGHVQSAHIAAKMHRWGPRLYSVRFSATTAQLALWQQLAAAQVTPAAAASASAPSGRIALMPGSGL